MTTLETKSTISTGRRLFHRGLAAILLTASCSAPTPKSPESSLSHQAVSDEPGITLYEDPAFTRQIGRLVSFTIECADYKNPDRQNLQPPHVNWYKVREDPPQHTPPLKGYISPNDGPLVAGTAPQCA